MFLYNYEKIYKNDDKKLSVSIIGNFELPERLYELCQYNWHSSWKDYTISVELEFQVSQGIKVITLKKYIN